MKLMSYRQTEDKPVQGDTFSVYYGQFMTSPIPIELSFSFCSHLCSYCFANINKPGRWADTEATLNTIKNADKRKTFLSYLINSGYPTLISNRTDPFSASNYRSSIPVIELMSATGMPMAFQTRGGFGVDDALKFIPKSCWYVSTPFTSEIVRKRVEPGSPSFSERLDLIRKLVDLGHHVSAAANPLVHEWQPDPLPLMEAIKSAGAYGVWIEPMHLSTRQIEMMPENYKTRLGNDVIVESKKQVFIGFNDYINSAIDSAISVGLEVFKTGQHFASKYFEPYHYVYQKTFPTFQGFLNKCHEDMPEGGEVSFWDYAEYVIPLLPDGEWPVHHYIGATSKDVLKEDPMPPNATFLDLLSRSWWDARTNYNPARNGCFAYQSYKEGDTTYVVTDEEGMPMMEFDPLGRFGAITNCN